MATPKSVGELNREHFDKAADSAYQIPWVKNLVGQITGFLSERVDWIGLPQDRDRKMLDYACGNGLISMALSPHISVTRGIDISGGMVDQFNSTARSHGLYPERMHAVQGNLLDDNDNLEGPDFWDLHLAVVSMALHHVDDPGRLVKKLAERLRPGGCLVIVDWEASEENRQWDLSGLAGGRTITRHGFRDEEMQSMIADAGLLDYAYLPHPEKSELPGGEGQLFWVRGRRASVVH